MLESLLRRRTRKYFPSTGVSMRTLSIEWNCSPSLRLVTTFTKCHQMKCYLYEFRQNQEISLQSQFFLQAGTISRARVESQVKTQVKTLGRQSSSQVARSYELGSSRLVARALCAIYPEIRHYNSRFEKEILAVKIAWPLNVRKNIDEVDNAHKSLAFRQTHGGVPMFAAPSFQYPLH